jgi:YidC/Oxa1 family membrane protein insertase
MDKIRFALWFGLLASIWISYETWVTEHQPPPAPATAAPAAEAPGSAVPTASGTATDADVGSLPTATAAAGEQAAPQATDSAPAIAPDRLISVRTDVLDLEIDLDGGDIVRADLLDYPVDKSNPNKLVRLLDYDPAAFWVFQTGFVSSGDRPAPNHEATFTTASDSYVLADGADTLEVRLEWRDPSGLSAAKVYTFHRSGYEIDLDLVVDNGTATAWPGNPYGQMTRRDDYAGRKFMNIESYSFLGPAVYDGDTYETIKLEDLATEPVDLKDVTNGWIASIQHHFLGAIVPPADAMTEIEGRAMGDVFRLLALGAAETVEPGASASYPLTLFIGPKLQDQLAAAAPGRELRRTVDYGLLYFLSQPLFWVLSFIHDWVRNWGVSIILTTLLIKLVFYRLTAASGRSMAKMRKIAPRMKALQEKHKDDRQALSAAMMELYKKEKVNPAAGCLPILIQMPFFFSFYWVLIESVEMRQAPFLLWINDLSVRDPFFILPGLMCAAMWFQTRLNPSPPDPVQARVMQIMPFAFSFMFAFFPAGLVLYWLTNTVSSIAQQWRINQLVSRES